VISDVLVVGGGMIAHDQILPSLLQLKRTGVIGRVHVCSQRGSTVKALRDAPAIRRAFPDQTFEVHQDLDSAEPQPDLFRRLIGQLPPRNLVVIALPDTLHFDAVMTALRAGQHVCCVKPLVLTARESRVIEEEARRQGLFVSVEYHKRLDDRSLIARRRYRSGLLGDFKLGTAILFEKWYYRHSNFQNWFTTDATDAFTYIGCHYVDLVHFITGLLPVSVSLYGLRDRFPNGAEGYLWTDARVLWNNGACLNVQNALGYPDDGPGSNIQGLTMWCATGERGAFLRHNDQYRGMEYCHVERPSGDGATLYAEPSPDYFQYVEHPGPGLKPVGYGYRSIELVVQETMRVEQSEPGLRTTVLDQIDAAGLLATPRNSRFNEFTVEAGRLSLANQGREAEIDYDGGSVRLK